MNLGMPIHEVCEIFPIMSDDELDGLIEDIARHGLREPVWTYEGKLIDGRNRLRACAFAGVEPTSREWDGVGSLVDFVRSLNLYRRHLNESQRAMAAAKSKPMYEAEAAARMNAGKNPVSNLTQGQTGRSRDRAAKAMNVSAGSVEAASTVLKNGTPKLVEAVERGEAKVSAAAEVAKLPAAAQDEVVAEGATAIKEKAAEIRKRRSPNRDRTADPEVIAQCTAIVNGSTGKTLLNGVLVDDPAHIAKKRAAGKIAPGVVPVETTSEPESDPAEEDGRIEGFGDSYEGPDESDEAWLASLPLSSKLKGNALRWFQVDALIYRTLEKERKAYAYHAARALKAADRSRQNGPYYRVVQTFLGTAHPRDWLACVDPKEEGCGGSGDLPGIGGECPKCDGRGFVIKRKWRPAS